jgi:hypothetical protein
LPDPFALHKCAAGVSLNEDSPENAIAGGRFVRREGRACGGSCFHPGRSPALRSDEALQAAECYLLSLAVLIAMTKERLNTKEKPKMPRKWSLDIQADESRQGGLSLGLSLTNPPKHERVEVVDRCGSLPEFKEALITMQSEIGQLIGEAERRLKELDSAQDQKEMEGVATEAVWKNMEACLTEEEMFSYFNSFNDRQRQQIAEFILTHASMFKGRGPVFAESYNMVTHTLEA